MANSKISKIKLDDTYLIDVATALKVTDSAKKSDEDLKVTTKGYVDTSIEQLSNANQAAYSGLKAEVDTKATEEDLEAFINKVKKPDGTHLFLVDNKINTAYISDTILGQLKFGGILNTANTLVPSHAICAALVEAGIKKYEDANLGSLSSDTAEINFSYKEISAYVDLYHEYPEGGDNTYTVQEYVRVTIPAEEGYFFISNFTGSIKESEYEGPDDIVQGDWLVLCNDVWQKVDNTDAVQGVNNKLGSVTITGSSGIEVNNTDTIDIRIKADEELLTTSNNTLTTKIIKKGVANNALTIGDATIPDDLSQLAGSIAAKAPIAVADGSLAAGVSSVAQSSASVAIGAASTAGIKGYYWHTIDFANNTITLSTTRPSTLNGGVSVPSGIDWQAGDYICIVNDAKYPCATTITKVSGNKITVESLPFTANNYDTVVLGATVYPAAATYTPDDRTIFAIKRSVLNNIVTLTPRSGSINLAWGAVVFGARNIGAGTFSFTAGCNNLTAGDFGATFGRDNTTGYAGLTTGWNNQSNSQQAIVGGTKNIVTRSTNALVFGEANTVAAGQALVGGYNNNVSDGSAGAIVSGDSNVVTKSYCNIISGKSNNVSSNMSVVAGENNILAAGCGSSAVLGASNKLHAADSFVHPTTNASVTTKASKYSFVAGHNNNVYGERNIIAGSNHEVRASHSVAFGGDHKLYNNYSAAVGYKNETHSSGTFVAGQYNKAITWCQAVFGRYNDYEVTKNDLLVVGNGQENSGTISRSNALRLTSSGQLITAGKITAGADPTNDLDVVTKRYFEDNSSKVDWEHIDSEVHVINDHNLEVDGNLTVHGELTLDGNLEFGEIAANKFVSAMRATDASTEANIVTGNYAAAIGRRHTVSNAQSMAVGYRNTHSSSCTFTAGEGLTVNQWCQTAVGKYNTPDANALFIVGNGSSLTAQSTAFYVHKDGKAIVKASTTASDSGKTLATKDYVDSHSGGSGGLSTKDIDNTYLTINAEGKLTVNVDAVLSALLAKEW